MDPRPQGHSAWRLAFGRGLRQAQALRLGTASGIRGLSRFERHVRIREAGKVERGEDTDDQHAQAGDREDCDSRHVRHFAGYLALAPFASTCISMKRLFRPLDLILAALHAYIGLRLLAPFGPAGQAAGATFLVGLFWLMPRSWWIREGRSVWRVMIPWIATGFFSWLLVLTVGRDVALLAGALAFAPADLAAWTRISALTVMALTPAITLVGFLMARQVAAVRHVDIRLADLPAALEGFTIAQITDVHVGPTIKGDFVQRIVERVNGLGADMVADRKSTRLNSSHSQISYA